jgi:hypothetical protein
LQNKWLRPGDPLPTLPSTRAQRVVFNPKRFSWRIRLRLASFKGAPFYVEQQGRSSGRRTVLHQYPKRDLPYAEDMGREALRYQITGYLIQAPTDPSRSGPAYEIYHGMPRDYDNARDLLESKLMEKSPGRLLDPYNPNLQIAGATMYGGPLGTTNPLLFMCERYTIIESREKGGFCQVEMAFVEAGIPGNMSPMWNTANAVTTTSNAATNAVAEQTNQKQNELDTFSQESIEALAKQQQEAFQRLQEELKNLTPSGL